MSKRRRKTWRETGQERLRVLWTAWRALWKVSFVTCKRSRKPKIPVASRRRSAVVCCGLVGKSFLQRTDNVPRHAKAIAKLKYPPKLAGMSSGLENSARYSPLTVKVCERRKGCKLNQSMPARPRVCVFVDGNTVRHSFRLAPDANGYDRAANHAVCPCVCVRVTTT